MTDDVDNGHGEEEPLPEIPAFIETTPDSFKPVEACTREEVLAAAHAYWTHAAMALGEAAGTIGADRDRARQLELAADEYRRNAAALERHAATL